MTVTTDGITVDDVERMAFESGQLMHIGAHEVDVTIGGVMYVARVERAA